MADVGRSGRGEVDSTGKANLPDDLALVISMISAHDRRSFQEAQLTSLGIPFRFVPAVTADNVAPEKMARLRRTWARPLRVAEVGCTLSHRAVWQEVVASGRPRLVLEDDAILTESIAPLMAELLARRDLTYVNLETYALPKLLSRQTEALATAPFRLALLYRDRGGSAGYVVWPEAAAKFLAATEQVIPLADASMNLAPGVIRHQIEPAAVVQAQFIRPGEPPFGSVGYSMILSEPKPDYAGLGDMLGFKLRRLQVSFKVLRQRLGAFGAETRWVEHAPDIRKS